MNFVVTRYAFVSWTLCAWVSASAQTPLVNHGDSWRYHKGSAGQPQLNWKTVANSGLDGTWLTGNGGIGYADNTPETALCQTILGDMRNNYTTVYLRREFTVSTVLDTAMHLQLTMDYDDGFIAWLDGVFLTSANSPNAPNEPAFNALATGLHESSRGGGPNPAVAYDLGVLGARLGVGTHVLAIMGLNEASSSSDLIQIADLALVPAPPPGGVSGPIAVNTVWRAADSPINVIGNVTVNSGVTLTIEPGVDVRFNQGVGIAINGRLLAEGEPASGIRFIPAVNATAWSGMTIAGGVGSPETRISYAYFQGNSSTAIHSSGGTLALDHLTFGTTSHQYLSLDGSSFLVANCVFPSATALFENVHGTGGIKSGGRGIFVHNFFGTANSVNGNYNDVLDFTGGNRPGQPIIQFYDNVFIGSGDDLLDLDGTDSWIEGNIFLHAHRNGSPDSASAVSGGNDGSRTSEITIIGNIFYDCDQAATGKEGNFYTLINNTVVHQTHVGGMDTAGAVVNFADAGTVEGRGMYLEGNIIYDAEALVRNLTTATVTFSDNFTTLPWTGLGGGNSAADPMLTYIPQLSETFFTSWEDAQVMRDWFSLQPQSPAIGAGPNGRDAGGVIPMGASISGEPEGTTTQKNATLVVGINRTGSGIPSADWPEGSGYTHYKWRLDGGTWSAETPIATPITLTGLPDGPHYVEVSGKNDADLYQDDPALGVDAGVTTSKTWTVESRPRIETVAYDGNVVTMTFVAQAGQAYAVDYRDAFDNAHPWTHLKDVPAQGSTAPVQVTDDSPPSDKRFYRLVVSTQP
jgi:hypothetical protein